MSDRQSVVKDQTLQDVEILREGDQIAFVIYITGVVSTLVSPTMTFYKQGSNTDLSGTYFTGSMSVSGLDTIVTKTTQNLKSGDWVMSISATVDGLIQNIATVPIHVKRKSDL